MRRVKLVKLKDDVFNNNHPNGINEGYVKEGFETNPPTIGERYEIYNSKMMTDWPFSTSAVKSLPDENGVFKTTYSTYKVKYEEE